MRYISIAVQIEVSVSSFVDYSSKGMLELANIRCDGPHSWSTAHDALLPGQAHSWSIGPFDPHLHAGSLSVPAHPAGLESHQSLAVEGLATAYARDDIGGAAANFLVRNVSDTAVWAYRIFVGIIDL
ncbi:hypothetical protein [Streptomyces sp. NPDC058294]|uniref:hypothetical protein n=1 Tax=Streptomyces sp. NPDC058294 TaxID=3346430 RepID=UPI0036E47298